jgi:hypothetical protein
LHEAPPDFLGRNFMFKGGVVTAVLLLSTAQGAFAQKWDAPLFFSPRPMDDIGAYYMRTNRDFPFDDANGLKLIWRQSGNLNLGVHLGTGDISNIGESILVGAELYGPLTRLIQTNSLALSWSLGIGAAFGDDEDSQLSYIDFSVPLGVSIGIPLGSGSTTILPYVHPRVSFDVVAITDDITDEEETFTDVGFAADLGAEVSLGRSLILRAAYTLGSDSDETGERNAFGVGVALRMQRKVIVR